MRLYQVVITSIVCVGLFSCASPRMSQEVQWGKSLFIEGDYKRSFHSLLPAAVNGSVDAQYAVGYMYYYGFGVPIDTESGLFWMTRAASQGSKPAIRALNLIAQGPTAEGPCVGATCQKGLRGAFKGEQGPVNVLPVWTQNPVYTPHVKRTYSSYLKNVHPVTAVPYQPIPPAVVAPVAPKVEPLPAPTPNTLTISQKTTSVAPTKKKIRTSSASLTSASDYALQLFGAYEIKDVKALQTELELKKHSQIFHTQNKGKDWYVLIYGKYPTVAEAKQAKSKLPGEVSELGPWVRKLNNLEVV